MKELSEILPKNDLDKILMRLGLREICEVPAMENGFDDHVGTLNGHTPELGNIFYNKLFLYFNLFNYRK